MSSIGINAAVGADDGDGETEADGLKLADSGVADGEGDSDGPLGAGDGEADGDIERLTLEDSPVDGDVLADSEAEGEKLPEGETLAEPEGDGEKLAEGLTLSD